MLSLGLKRACWFLANVVNILNAHKSVLIPFLKDYIALAVLRKYENEVSFAIADFGYFPRISLNFCCKCLIGLAKEFVFDVLPESLNRVQLWTVRWQKNQHHVVSNHQRLGMMKASIIENDNIKAVGKSR